MNCDESGQYSITYFINPHLKELLGDSLGVTLEKRINDLANGEMKDSVKSVPLNRRYDNWFKQIQAIPYYKVTVTERILK